MKFLHLPFLLQILLFSCKPFPILGQDGGIIQLNRPGLQYLTGVTKSLVDQQFCVPIPIPQILSNPPELSFIEFFPIKLPTLTFLLVANQNEIEFNAVGGEFEGVGGVPLYFKIAPFLAVTSEDRIRMKATRVNVNLRLRPEIKDNLLKINFGICYASVEFEQGSAGLASVNDQADLKPILETELCKRFQKALDMLVLHLTTDLESPTDTGIHYQVKLPWIFSQIPKVYEDRLEVYFGNPPPLPTKIAENKFETLGLNLFIPKKVLGQQSGMILKDILNGPIPCNACKDYVDVSNKVTNLERYSATMRFSVEIDSRVEIERSVFAISNSKFIIVTFPIRITPDGLLYLGADVVPWVAGLETLSVRAMKVSLKETKDAPAEVKMLPLEFKDWLLESVRHLVQERIANIPVLIPLPTGLSLVDSQLIYDDEGLTIFTNLGYDLADKGKEILRNNATFAANIKKYPSSDCSRLIG